MSSPTGKQKMELWGKLESVSALKQKNIDLERENLRLKQDSLELKQENLQSRESEKELRAELLKRADTLAKERESYKAEIQDISGKNVLLGKEIEKLLRENADLRAENVELRKQLDTIHAENKGLKKRVDGLSRSEAALEKRVDSLGESEASLEEQVGRLYVGKTSLEKQVAALTERLDALEPSANDIIKRQAIDSFEWFICVDAVGEKIAKKINGRTDSVVGRGGQLPAWITQDVSSTFDRFRDNGNRAAHPKLFTKRELEDAMLDGADDDDEIQIKKTIADMLEGFYAAGNLQFGAEVKPR